MQTSAAVAGGVMVSPLALASNPHVNDDQDRIDRMRRTGIWRCKWGVNTGDDVRLVAMADAFH